MQALFYLTNTRGPDIKSEKNEELFLAPSDYIPKSDGDAKPFGYIITALAKNENEFSLFTRL